MEQNLAPQGPGGRRLHIAHRRSPSELTPLMSKSTCSEIEAMTSLDAEITFALICHLERDEG